MGSVFYYSTPGSRSAPRAADRGRSLGGRGGLLPGARDGAGAPHKKRPNFSLGTADFSTCAGHITGFLPIAALSFSSPPTAYPFARSPPSLSPLPSMCAHFPTAAGLRMEWSPFTQSKVLADFGGRRGRPGVATKAFFRGPISGLRNKHILLYWLWARFFIIPPPARGPRRERQTVLRV